MSLTPELVGRALGRYELVRRLATGGMAEIYLARIAGIAQFEKQLVVKRMLPHLARDPQYVDMFLSEARVAARLDHPHIVRVEDIGEDALNYYYAMEYVRGADLLQLMQVLARQNRTVPLEAAVAIGIALCSALAFAHEQTDAQGRPLNVVHRDVSLPNVLLSYEGAVKLADFGVAQVDDRRRTRSGVLKGKLGYMSPEQCRGESLDRRSDIFALGIVLYEITTGERLFAGAETDFAVMDRIVRCEITPPSELMFDYPVDLAAILMTALQRDRDDRYQDAREMQRDLESFLRVHRLAGSPSCVAELVTRTFPIATRRPSNLRLNELVVEEPPPSSDQRLVPQPAQSLSDADLVASEITSVVAPDVAFELAALDPSVSPPVPDLRHRSYVPVIAVMMVVLAGIGISAWAAWSNMYAPDEMSAVLAAETTTPEITISSVRWAPPATAPPERTPPRRPKPTPPRPQVAPPARLATTTTQRPARRPAPRHAAKEATEDAASAPEISVDPVADRAFSNESPPVVADREALFPRPTVVVPPAPPAPPAPPKAAPPPPVRTGSFDATPTIASLDVRGPLTDSVVRQGVERTLSSLRTCYRTAARTNGATPSAVVRIAFEIDETRTATRIQASGGASLGGLAACASGAANEIRTRHAPDVGNARVVVTIAFRPT